MFDEKVLSKLVFANLITSVALLVVAITVAVKISLPTGVAVAAPDAPQVAAQPAAQEAPQAQAEEKISQKYHKGMSFEKALTKGKPIAVLFYADWCGFCKRFVPTFAELSKDKDLKRKYNFVYVNSDSPEARKYMQQYEVRGFPTLYLINPKTIDKAHVSNGLMFQGDAFNVMKEQFEKFLTDGSSAVTQPEPPKAEEE